MIEGGDLDINFIVTGPDQRHMVMDPHQMDGLHALDIKQTGEYEICLDNTFSRMTGKSQLVFSRQQLQLVHTTLFSALLLCIDVT